MITFLSSLRVRSLLMILVAVLPPLCVLGYTAVEWRRHETEEAHASALQVVRHASAIHRRLVDESHDMLFSLAYLPAVLRADRRELAEVLRAFLREHPDHREIGVILPDGRLFASTRAPDEAVDVADRPFFRRAVQTRTFVAGDHEIDRLAGRASVTFAYPILDAVGGLERVVFATTDVAWVSELTDEARLHQGTTVTVFDQNGTIVAREPDATAWVGRSAAGDPVFQAIRAGNRQGVVDGTSLDGVPRLFAFTALPGRAGASTLFLSVGIPAVAATATSDRILARNLIGLAVAAVAAMVLAWLASDLFLVRRVQALLSATKRISGGDLSARAGLPHEPGELNQLAKAFDEMAATLEKRQAEIAGHTSEREAAEESLRRAHDELELRVHERTVELAAANVTLRAEVAVRRRTEEALRKLSRAIEQTGDSVFVADRSGTIEYVNRAFEKLTGFPRDEAIGANPRILRSGEHDRRFYETLWTTILAGKVFRCVFVNRTKDGRLYHEDQTITPIRDSEGAITHFVSTGRDITDRRRTEAALRRLNNQLEHEATRIAGILHDEAGQFLTAAHITLAEVGRDLPAPARERLHDVRHNLDLVEAQLRRLAHEFHPRIIDDMGLVDALRFLANGVARRTGIPVVVDTSLERRCPRLVETILYRLVQEALTNMTKHARATRGTIALRQDGPTIHCSIRDDGIGFDVAAVTGRRGESGLGLLGIQDRLEAVGGTLVIVSAPGKGSEITAAVPLAA